ncbi:hypothetical protein EX30DRAFT_372611 [Ascodesmis nigricans]|uniref:Uncharacterized protein n=1 Tax=Ascodesmis nigricans TaxID=341454 RepID=A0A4S2MTN0_9PEZI|nr:hypothetical protein EX30DRAFT_372611 [Ascodesmis nigricans]
MSFKCPYCGFASANAVTTCAKCGKYVGGRRPVHCRIENVQSSGQPQNLAIAELPEADADFDRTRL